MKISVSNGIEYFETKEFSTVKELAEQACKTNISTSVFKDGAKRNIDNFLYAECIGLDFDNNPGEPTLSLEEAKLALKEYRHVILATRSHQKEKNGYVADRFRVILFLESPIDNPDDFKATWFKLAEQFPAVDRQCSDPSRFWYRHQAILSGNDGKLVPVAKAPVKPPKEPVKASEGEKGKLSKQTYEHLAMGIPKGKGLRNGSVHKMAKDFQQNLYTYEEAETQIVDALTRTETLDDEFPEEEAIRTIQSAYNRAPKHEPRLGESEPNLGEEKPRAFTYFSIADILSMPDKEEDWLVEGLLIKGGMSMIVGAPKTGKTTLMRQLERCILRGEPFLGRKTQKGSILHYSFDEKARTAKRHYRTLGLTPEDPLMLHFGAAGSEKHIDEFEEDLLNHKPILAVVDTLFDMADVEDINSYIPIKKKLTIFGTIAEKTGTHILFIHHQTKPNKEHGSGSGISVLGSQAIFASVDCCMIFEKVKDSKNRTLAVEGRGIEDFEKRKLIFDYKTQMYVLEPDPF